MAAFGDYGNRCPHGIERISQRVCRDCEIARLEQENARLRAALERCRDKFSEIDSIRHDGGSVVGYVADMGRVMCEEALKR